MTLATSRPLAETVSVVLVHGAFVDASGWRKVYDTLSEEGFEVLVVQNSAVGFHQDVERTKSVIAEAKHPVVLVGHSYGGAVITEAGSRENPQSRLSGSFRSRRRGMRFRPGLARVPWCGESSTPCAEGWLHQDRSAEVRGSILGRHKSGRSAVHGCRPEAVGP